MLELIKKYIKNLNAENKFLLLFIIKLLSAIATFIFINIGGFFLIIGLADLLQIQQEKRSFLALFPILFMVLSLITCFFQNQKISDYCLTFFSDEDIIKNINLFFNYDKGIINEQFVYLYKEKESLLFDNLKEITEKIGSNWIILVKADVRKLLLNKYFQWYSKQISNKELYQYCKNTISEIIQNQETEYYHIIFDSFNDFIENEQLNLIKNKITEENIISVIHI